MKERILIVVLFLFSLFFIGNGITGFATLRPDFKFLCSQDNPCEHPEVCCLFFGESSGVCDTGDKCEEIYSFTEQERLRREEAISLLSYKESRETFGNSYTSQLVLGLFIFFLALIFFTHHSRNSPHAVKKESKKA
jgi:hypothetical protein